MKATKLMRKKSESAKGFTLIELMIVVAIIGILASVAIPNFLKARDKARWMTCVEAASSLKVAQEMYISDEGVYAEEFKYLSIYMIPGCEEADGSDCATDVYDRVSGGATGNGTCHDISLVPLAVTSGATGYDYEFVATSRDRYSCKICMKPAGYLPSKYSACEDGMAVTCP